jgi:hypothetical protein
MVTPRAVDTLKANANSGIATGGSG